MLHYIIYHVIGLPFRTCLRTPTVYFPFKQVRVELADSVTEIESGHLRIPAAPFVLGKNRRLRMDKMSARAKYGPPIPPLLPPPPPLLLVETGRALLIRQFERVGEFGF